MIKEAEFIGGRLRAVMITAAEQMAGASIRWYFGDVEAWLFFPSENPLLGAPKAIQVEPNAIVTRPVRADADPGKYQYAALVQGEDGTWAYVPGGSAPEIIILSSRT